MSDKSTNPSTSAFTSGRPDRIRAALQPREGVQANSSANPRVRAKQAQVNSDAYVTTENTENASHAAQNEAPSQRAQLGQGPKRKASDSLSEILRRQKPQNAPTQARAKGQNGVGNSANDDIAHAANLLEEIKSDTSKKPIFVALAFSVVWVVLCVAVGLSLFNSGLVNTNAVSLTSLSALVAIAAVLFIPCVLSWGVAVFLYRARELHQISLSLAYTALHLTQPEDMASESIATIGQAVRREVAAMGDGIDRAISRATSLESKFRTEVGNIQGFYRNNENIFNKIIMDLERERDLMAATGDNLEERLPKILDSLKESSFDFSNIVQSADEKFTALATTADTRLTSLSDSIAEKNAVLQTGLDETVKNVASLTDVLEVRTKDLDGVTDKMINVGTATNNKLEKISDNFNRQTTDLGFATSAILKANEEINLALQGRHENLSSSAEHLLENAEQINNLLSSFAGVIDSSLLNAEDRSQNMQVMLREAAQESANILQAEMTNIRQSTAGETQRLVELLQQSSFTATTALSEEIKTIIGGSQNEVQAALNTLLRESQFMSENLKSEANAIAAMMHTEMQTIKDSAVGNTAESLAEIRQGHEKAIDDIIGRIELAGEKLTGTTENLGFVANRMDQEMETTRKNLADTVESMPAEAKQALLEMQGFVDEQVTALSELAKTVGEFGTPVSVPDVNVITKAKPSQKTPATTAREPRPRSRPTEARNEKTASPATAATQRRQTARKQQDAAIEKAGREPATQMPPRQEPSPQEPQARRERSRPPQPQQPVVKPRNEATRPRNAPAKKTDERQGQEQNKWEMPDLLSRASADQKLPEHLQPEAEPKNKNGERRAAKGRQSELHSVESLNALSLDLAKALDHEAPDQLWARYRNGERNVFTRRLYTLRGQKLFDEVSHKYAHEAGFRRDVDRYIGDFEELLTKIYEQDRDSMLIDTYLSSETGKVYLMLAHASGRLD